MAPQFKAVARKELKKPPLELVVCQVRFPTILALSNGRAPEEFQKKLTSYPIVKEKHQQRVEVILESGTQRISRTPYWTFEDADSQWTVSLAPTFLALETKNYKRFTNFIAKFDAALKVARDLYSLTVRERLGLRYVDRLSRTRCPELPEDWLSKIQPRLLSLRNVLNEGETLHAVCDYRVANGDRILAIKSLLKQYGFPNVGEDELVLDFDCYTEERGNFDDIETRLKAFKGVSYDAFRWAISDLINYFPVSDGNG